MDGAPSDGGQTSSRAHLGQVQVQGADWARPLSPGLAPGGVSAAAPSQFRLVPVGAARLLGVTSEGLSTSPQCPWAQGAPRPPEAPRGGAPPAQSFPWPPWYSRAEPVQGSSREVVLWTRGGNGCEWTGMQGALSPSWFFHLRRVSLDHCPRPGQWVACGQMSRTVAPPMRPPGLTLWFLYVCFCFLGHT